MYRFFVEPSQIQDKRIVITGRDVNHIKNVLRMKIGEEIAVSNGIDSREYRCGIEEYTEDEVICTLRFIKEDGVELPSKIYLFQGLPKVDKMELVIQKAVELGVYEVIPVAAKRCVVKLDDKKAAAKVSRWQGIAEAAAKQSKRSVIPAVHAVMSMGEAIAYAKDMDVRLIPYELAEDMSHTKALIEAVSAGSSIAVFIGPEGGFEESEVQAAVSAGIEPITLGRRILRTETAGMTVLSWLMYQLES
ncbi:MAG: 16S rRNA (uracil(1498)-N(3))-methyltransferase [Lachnospiraceae bacterium]|nr:16S rRNA (uracil(1498)-N(3))-methyltransferase [Lachnospiraceae bacterium]